MRARPDERSNQPDTIRAPRSSSRHAHPIQTVPQTITESKRLPSSNAIHCCESLGITPENSPWPESCMASRNSSSVAVLSLFSSWLLVPLPRGEKHADDLWLSQPSSVFLLIKDEDREASGGPVAHSLSDINAIATNEAFLR